ncbi:MAG: hypothetical protein ACR2RL_02905 [Gammaproteobacteria bacterium]
MNPTIEHLIPDYWTPEQALAAFDLANAIAELIWQRYHSELLPLLEPDAHDENQLDLPFNDSIPF